MPDNDIIAGQQSLLATYRQTLAHLVQQAALHGGEPFAPPATANGIAEARANIALLKTNLRARGVTVADESNDAPRPQLIPTQLPRTGTEIGLSEERNITTGGGDYTEGSLDKRQGGFAESSTAQRDVIAQQNNYFYGEQITAHDQAQQQHRYDALSILLGNLRSKSFTLLTNELLCAQYTIWRIEDSMKWSWQNQHVFAQILEHRWKDRRPRKILLFLYLVAQISLEDVDRRALERDIDEATETLKEEREWAKQQLDETQRQYQILLNSFASLQIIISRRLEEFEKPTFDLRYSLIHKGIRISRHDPYIGCTFDELKAHVWECAQGKDAALFAERLNLEFLLDFDTLLDLTGIWDIPRWEYEVIRPGSKTAKREMLGAKFPIVVRLHPDDRASLDKANPATNMIWRKKSQLLTRWFQAKEARYTPKIVSSHPAHPAFIDPDDWDAAVAATIFQDFPTTPAENQLTFDDMIEHSIPISLWPASPQPAESYHAYMEPFYIADMLDQLPRITWQHRRRYKKHPHHPAYQVILYSDLWSKADEEPENDGFWPPEEEGVV